MATASHETSQISLNEDDGGSAKNDDRKKRRDNIRNLIKTVSAITCIFFFFAMHTLWKGLMNTEEENWKQDLSFHDGIQMYHWADPRMLPPIPNDPNSENKVKEILLSALEKKKQRNKRSNVLHETKDFFNFRHVTTDMKWEAKADEFLQESHPRGPKVDYTAIKYSYPDIIDEPPVDGQYPSLKPLKEVLQGWDQNNIDQPPQPFQETLLHFDYSDKKQMEIAKKYRDMEIPFKLYNVPELQEAGLKWTDEYVSNQFDTFSSSGGVRANGHAQESMDNFFSFFKQTNWDFDLMGPPPTYDIGWNFELWAKHARYADRVSLNPDEKHYYWQAGASKKERYQKKSSWSFIGKDLPSFSSTSPNFISFAPEYQKGIQCRFGERGVVAATHYDDGRNMVAMITGAKRYILAPPNQCTLLGIVTDKRHPVYRHSLLNFGHLSIVTGNNKKAEDAMPLDEQRWLERAGESLAIDTVLKAGEVLYIPSYWFHYIISLQKSAQCNTRSGSSHHTAISHIFGDKNDVKKCVGEATD